MIFGSYRLCTGVWILVRRLWIFPQIVYC